MKRKAWIAAAAGTLALAACSSGGSSGDDTALTIWMNYTTEPGQAWLEGVIDEFEAAHEG